MGLAFVGTLLASLALALGTGIFLPPVCEALAQKLLHGPQVAIVLKDRVLGFHLTGQSVFNR